MGATPSRRHSSPGAPGQGARRREGILDHYNPPRPEDLAAQTSGPAGKTVLLPLRARVCLRRALLRALSDNPPTVDRLPARGEVFLRRANTLQETEGLLGK